MRSLYKAHLRVTLGHTAAPPIARFARPLLERAPPKRAAMAPKARAAAA